MAETIEQIAQRVARTMYGRFARAEDTYEPHVEFAKALVAELTKQQEPVACVADFSQQQREQFLSDGYLLSDPVYARPAIPQPAAVLKMSERVRKEVIGWLTDAAHDAAEEDFDSGIFADREAAEALGRLAAMLSAAPVPSSLPSAVPEGWRDALTFARSIIQPDWENSDGENAPMREWCMKVDAMLSAAPAANDRNDAELSASARDVLAERRRQVDGEGWTPGHDDEHSNGEMAEAAAAYASEATGHHGGLPNGWPWAREWWKPAGRRRNLIKAGALILAEIERLDRAAMAPSREGA